MIATSAVAPLDEAETAARSLLLAPSVAILLVDSVNSAPRLLRLATLMEDAIDAGICVLPPESSIAESGYFDLALVQAYSTKATAPEDMGRRAQEVASRMDVALATDAAARFPDRLDLATATAAQVRDVRALLERSLSVDTAAPETDRFRFLPDLMSLHIPNVALAADDLVRMRRDGQFEDLRNG